MQICILQADVISLGYQMATKSSSGLRTPAPLLTEKQVAKRWGMPAFTLRNGRSRGYGPAYLKLGHSVRYRAEDVETWLESRRIQPGAAAR